MATFRTLDGLMNNILKMGGTAGNIIKKVATGFALRDTTDANNVNLTIADATADTMATTLLQLKRHSVFVEFGFDGAAAPAAGTNTGKYGFCHTAGGAYNAGGVYYDDGTTVLSSNPVTLYKNMLLTTAGAAINGTVSLIANGLYQCTDVATRAWVAKGDGSGASTGVAKEIRLTLGTGASYSSTTSVPQNAKVESVKLVVSTAYDNAATIAVIVDGTVDTTIMTTTENDPTATNVYFVEPMIDIDAANKAGVVTANITGTPTQGVAQLVISYTEAYLA